MAERGDGIVAVDEDLRERTDVGDVNESRCGRCRRCARAASARGRDRDAHRCRAWRDRRAARGARHGWVVPMPYETDIHLVFEDPVTLPAPKNSVGPDVNVKDCEGLEGRFLYNATSVRVPSTCTTALSALYLCKVKVCVPDAYVAGVPTTCAEGVVPPYDTKASWLLVRPTATMRVPSRNPNTISGFVGFPLTLMFTCMNASEVLLSESRRNR